MRSPSKGPEMDGLDVDRGAQFVKSLLSLGIEWCVVLPRNADATFPGAAMSIKS